jgi:hypothetical protein
MESKLHLLVARNRDRSTLQPPKLVCSEPRDVTPDEVAGTVQLITLELRLDHSKLRDLQEPLALELVIEPLPKVRVAVVLQTD